MHRWEDNIKDGSSRSAMGGVVDWMDLAQDRNRWLALVNAVIKLWVQ